MNKKRCSWVNLNNPKYVNYHDYEWGEPVYEDNILFEFLILEGAQAGLNWETILNRREGYRKAFGNFNPAKVAKFGNKDIERLVNDKGIIRNKLKIKSAINNAQRFLEVQKEFGSFSNYIWGFAPLIERRLRGEESIKYVQKNNFIPPLEERLGGVRPIYGKKQFHKDIPTSSTESDSLSKDLKKRGFSFVGPTIMYAYMQACGLVNDHEEDCYKYTRKRLNKSIT